MEAWLLVKEEQRGRVLRSRRENPSQTLDAQLIGHVPNTQHLEGEDTVVRRFPPSTSQAINTVSPEGRRKVD